MNDDFSNSKIRKIIKIGQFFLFYSRCNQNGTLHLFSIIIKIYLKCLEFRPLNFLVNQFESNLYVLVDFLSKYPCSFNDSSTFLKFSIPSCIATCFICSISRVSLLFLRAILSKAATNFFFNDV